MGKAKGAMYETKIEKVQIEKLDLDFEYKFDMISGQGIRLRSPEAFTKGKKVEKVMDGLQSPFFGSDFADEYAFAERYSCKCKRYVGKAFVGVVCEHCGSPVEYIDVDMTKTGWIVLDYFKVISPIYAMKLEDALGKVDGEPILNKILDTSFNKMELSPSDEKEMQLLSKKHPFIKKGMLWLSENIDEVLDFYGKRKGTKQKLFEELKADSHKIFTSAIPVYSSVLRIENPGEKDKKLFKLKANTIFMSLIRSSNSINDFGKPSDINEKDLITINRYLFTMHKEIVELFMEIFKILNGKKGIIQGRVISGRMNFSARNIITSDSGFLRCDEVELGYITFMELFRYEIINQYAKITNCTAIEAQDRWKRGLVYFDSTLYNIMETMIDKNQADLNIIINRNPSINFGSFLTMRVKHVKPNIYNKTMTIPCRVLKVMAADFDGDQLNIFRIPGMDFAKRFGKNMNPRYNLYIDRINGRVNNDLMPMKDELIGFWAFNNM